LTSDPEAALAAALNERGPVAPLLMLRYAAEWAARTTLKEAYADDMAAFECVVALDDTLPPVRELMRQVPELVKLAAAGATVGDRLTASGAELSRQQTALAADRAGLEEARELLARLAAVEAERNRLRGEILRAQHAAAIERELPALRQTLAELTAAVSAAGRDTKDADAVLHGLIAAGRRLVELTEEQRSILDAGNDQLAAKVADAVGTAARALARRDELATELAARDLDAAGLRAEEEQTLPDLRAKRQADSDLVAGLLADGPAGGQAAASFSALEYVRAELAELGRRLADTEGHLRPLLRQHQQTYDEASKVRGLNG
jgi:hypothetical protein